VDAWFAKDVDAWFAKDVDAWFATGVDAWFATGVDAWFATGVDAWFAMDVDAWVATGVDAWFAMDVDAWFATGVDAWFAMDVDAWVARMPSACLIVRHAWRHAFLGTPLVVPRGYRRVRRAATRRPSACDFPARLVVSGGYRRVRRAATRRPSACDWPARFAASSGYRRVRRAATRRRSTGMTHSAVSRATRVVRFLRVQRQTRAWSATLRRVVARRFLGQRRLHTQACQARHAARHAVRKSMPSACGGTLSHHDPFRAFRMRGHPVASRPWLAHADLRA